MAMDKFPVVGHQMTHSLDSFITDSANSATALYTGHKSTVNALGAYADSSEDAGDDPKVETIAELFQNLRNGGVGIVSTAYIADATPAALTAHNRDRDEYGAVIESYLQGITNYTWVNWTGPDVLFGGGAEQFFLNEENKANRDFYAEFAENDYNIVLNNTALQDADPSTKTLGIFSTDNMAKWLDRNIYTDNLRDQGNAPDGSGGDATDQPGLKEMTLKAIEILHQRHEEAGFFLMVEAASIDKQMHTLDYDRALGELLELDDSVRAAKDYLTEISELEDTLILVTADHGHGFDVAGSVDTQYLSAQDSQREKRNAVGLYAESGLSEYTGAAEGQQRNASVSTSSSSVAGGVRYMNGPHFPTNWDPRYTLYQGVTAFPDHREDYQVNKDGPREPAINRSGLPEEDFYANDEDSPGGILINGTLPVSADQGVHSLTDVPVFASGPCQELFGGVYGNVDVFFAMADCLGLSRPSGSEGAAGDTGEDDDEEEEEDGDGDDEEEEEEEEEEEDDDDDDAEDKPENAEVTGADDSGST